MARMRTTKPEYWADEDLADLPRDARLLYMGLWNLSDEWSRLRGRADYIKGQLFPYDDDLPPGEIDHLLDLLAKAGKVVRYAVASRSYLFLPNLSKHQRLEPDKVPSRLPAPPDSSLLEPEPSPSEPRPDEAARDADVSKSDAKDHALKHVAGSRGHVAAAAREPRAVRSAFTIIRTTLEPNGCTDDEARAVAERINRDRKPKNLAALVRTIATAGDLPDFLDALRADTTRADAAVVIAAARDGPPCPHGDPGGDQPHPESGQPLCPKCRRLTHP